MQVKARHLHGATPAGPVSDAARSLEDAARRPPEAIQDDGVFLASHLSTRGLRGPKLLRTGIKKAAAIKDKRRAAERQEIEALAELHLRHRIADNERRYPEIFKAIRSTDFLAEYERKAGQPWQRQFEADIDEMRCRLLLVSR